MSFQSTLGSITARVVNRVEVEGLTMKFDAGSTEPVVGTIMKMNNDGTVAPASATTDFPIGMCTVPKNAQTGNTKVTVLTPFQAEVTGVASGAVVAGSMVAVAGFSSGVTSYSAISASGVNYAVGVALESASNGGSFKIGLFRVAKTVSIA